MLKAFIIDIYSIGSAWCDERRSRSDRSLGSEVSTEKTTEEPAWLQNLEDTTERAGRAQDKEDLMERLRDLGYM